MVVEYFWNMFIQESDYVNTSLYIDEPPISPYIETFFSTYASIPPSALRDHLISIRERAWNEVNYPCFGLWSFLHFSIKTNPLYQEILEKCIYKGATFIDFGCCLGQEIRQLVYDGISPDQLRGYDLNPFFIEQGYELFRDGKVMKEKKVFTSGDIFDDQFLETIEPADYVCASSFIHLFDAETQNDVCRRLTRLSKNAIVGQQLGASITGERARRRSSVISNRIQHSPETFARMWDEATDGKWKVESASLDTMYGTALERQILTFVVRKKIEQ